MLRLRLPFAFVLNGGIDTSTRAVELVPVISASEREVWRCF